jgi:hypothetical protein
MIVQFFGMDEKTRTDVSIAYAERTNSWHVLDTDLPMAELQAQYARWLRTISIFFTKDYNSSIVVSGYFPTKEARDQFRDISGYMHLSDTAKFPDISVWIDTTDKKEFTDKFGKVISWEEPEENEYDLRITNTGNEYLDALPTVIKKYETFDWKPEQTLMVGKFQPWTDSDLEKYNELSKTRNVVIGIRHCMGMSDEDKLSIAQVKSMILKDIPNADIVVLPNIVEVV